jgi:two-component system, NtrC family, nitrogen regulation sensor histidine kinase NtrY
LKILRYAIAICALTLVSSSLYIFINDADRILKRQLSIAENNLAHIEAAFKGFGNEKTLHQKLINGVVKNNDKSLIEKMPFEVFAFKGEKSIYWSTNEIQINYIINKIDETPGLFELKNGYYILQKIRKGNGAIILAHLVKSNYSIENKFLQNKFNQLYPLPPSVLITSPEEADFVLDFFEKPLIGLKTADKTAAEISKHNIPAGYTAVFSLQLLAMLIVFWILLQHGFSAASAALIIGFIVVKIVLHLLPAEIFDTPLFSPELYASSVFGSSMGYLLIHIAWFFMLASLVLYQIKKHPRYFNKKSIYLLAVIIAIMVAMYAKALKSAVLDSVISYKINTFAELNNYTLLGMFAIMLATAGVFMLIVSFLNTLKNNPQRYWLVLLQSLLIAAIAFAIQPEWPAFILPVIYLLFTLIFLYLLHSRYEQSFFSKYITVIIFSSAIIALFTNHYNGEKERIRKLKVASQLSSQKDLVAEYTFNQRLIEIKNDPFIKKYFTSPFISSKELFQRINYLYFGGYFSKYNVEIRAFNTEGKLMKSPEQDSLEYYRINLGIESHNEKLNYLPEKDGSFRYIALIHIESNEKTAGYLLFILTPKKFQSENVYPELLIEEKNKPIVEIELEIFDYAIYNNGTLSAQGGDYPYPYRLDFEQKEKPIKRNQFQHLLYTDNEGKVIVVSSPIQSLLIPFSIFSYLFFFYIMLSIMVILGISIYYRWIDKNRISWLKSSFRYKINLSILAIIVTSFVIIGSITISYFAREYDEYHKQSLIQKQKAIITNIENLLRISSKTESSIKINDFFQNTISAELRNMADMHAIDINIYSKEGRLIASSQPGIFTAGLLSHKMHPRAYEKAIKREYERLIQNEKIGKLQFIAAYIPIRNEEGKIVAYLNLPYFNKENSFVKEVSEFVVAFINVYVLMLVIASILGLLVSNSITASLAQIGEKLSEVTISRKNDFLQWDADDEIGTLVKEYNKMIAQLEEGAQALARSERESAWREMARQIAHEIKNPLTPMKLSIQHLQRAMKDDPERGVELTQKVAQNLIEQIDNLSDIATAFSSFAQMPKPDKEEVDLLPLIQNVAQLFSTDTGIAIQIESSEKEAMTMADKNQMISVFNNLIKNAIQAVEEKTDGRIDILLKREEPWFLITVSDNGTGIAESMKHKVFVPNFTTKSSGTGLGLAISKQIVENSGGEIWFDSEEGKGTRFYVKLPVLFTQNNS